MAEISKTTNYGLTIFDDAQTNLTFKEWRNYLAGVGASEDDYSNMQIIDKLLKQADTSIKENLLAAKNYAEEQIALFKKENEDLIKNTEGTLIIGGESGKQMEFRDGAKTAYLKDGVFTVGGVETEFVRIVDYLLKYNSNNKHLQLSYKPKVDSTNGGV